MRELIIRPKYHIALTLLMVSIVFLILSFMFASLWTFVSMLFGAFLMEFARMSYYRSQIKKNVELV